MTNVATGRMSLSEFYARRVRRIAPAFFMVMFCTSVAAWFLLPTHQMLDYGRSLAAASLLVSNVLFWRGSGYFDLEAELRPLLHTWSLGVKEQFYIFYPLLLLWALKRRAKKASKGGQSVACPPSAIFDVVMCVGTLRFAHPRAIHRDA